MQAAILVFQDGRQVSRAFPRRRGKSRAFGGSGRPSRFPAIVLGVIDWRGTILPVLSMRRRLHLPETPICLDDRLIIARSSRRRLALLVEEIVRVASLSEQDMAAAQGIREGIDSITGAVKMDGGHCADPRPRFLPRRAGEISLEGALVRAGAYAHDRCHFPEVTGGALGVRQRSAGFELPAERWDDLARRIGLAAHFTGYPDPETFARSVLSAHVPARRPGVPGK